MVVLSQSLTELKLLCRQGSARRHTAQSPHQVWLYSAVTLCFCLLALHRLQKYCNVCHVALFGLVVLFCCLPSRNINQIIGQIRGQPLSVRQQHGKRKLQGFECLARAMGDAERTDHTPYILYNRTTEDRKLLMLNVSALFRKI